MTKKILIENGTIVNEERRFFGWVLVENDRIAGVGEGKYLSDFQGEKIDAAGKFVFPGIIDCHVHFREPGLTQKGDMSSESAAAVAGGVTSVLEMPNTVPAATTRELLEQKFELARGRMHTNYSFFLGAAADNLAEIKRLDLSEICGVKLFMGSSTGGMLVDDDRTLSALFAEFGGIIAAHCEDEAIIRSNTELYRKKYGDDATAAIHPLVRSAEACYVSSARAVELADKYGTRLHVCHLTTARELALFSNGRSKQITAEACIPHLRFTDQDYPRLGNLIKCNPAIKTAEDRNALRKALADNKIDIIATDHAPHTREEKSRNYWNAPSGIPMVQHSLVAMWEILPPELVVEKMCHAPALCFGIKDRGFLRTGYKADIAIVDPAAEWTVSPENILYKCGWSPLEGTKFSSRTCCTIINGQVVWDGKKVDTETKGERLVFKNN